MGTTIHEATAGSRRRFLIATGGAALAAPFLLSDAAAATGEKGIAPMGPASKYVPTIRMAFVRRKGDYGILWPGAVYDGQAALHKYRKELGTAALQLGIDLAIRQHPLYSLPEAEQWVAECQDRKPDGLLLVVLDRQQHAWPTAKRVVDSGIPAVVFAPVGTAFTTNTASLANVQGSFVCSTDDVTRAIYGMKMIRAAAKLREMRFVVVKGKERKDSEVKHFGTRLRYLPASDFLEEYNRTPLTDEVKQIAAEYVRNATRVSGASKEDVYNGVKSYVVARSLLEREEGDGITMDCLGALGRTKVSLPCIAWSRMLDHGVPAACEADLGAALTHALVQFLFERPGFQQDPVAETSKDCLIGAHCTCPTRLNGFSRPPEPYRLSHHHGNRDAVPVPTWRPGQRMTVADILPSNDDAKPPQMYISSGEVVDNVSVPPAGGCVVSVMVRLDGVTELLAYPGFHQVFFYGDFAKHLRQYCQLFRIEALVT
jgi:hypothetical protein